MFGTANQLLATIALTVGTSYLINNGKVRYSWVTIIPLVFVGITTLTAGTMNISGIYIPQLSTEKHLCPGIGQHDTDQPDHVVGADHPEKRSSSMDHGNKE